MNPQGSIQKSPLTYAFLVSYHSSPLLVKIQYYPYITIIYYPNNTHIISYYPLILYIYTLHNILSIYLYTHILSITMCSYILSMLYPPSSRGRSTTPRFSRRNAIAWKRFWQRPSGQAPSLYDAKIVYGLWTRKQRI